MAAGADTAYERSAITCAAEARGIARCLEGRLMKVITTNPGAAQPCPDDKVTRAFLAAMQNQIWVSDFTYVSKLQGMVYPWSVPLNQWRAGHQLS